MFMRLMMVALLVASFPSLGLRAQAQGEGETTGPSESELEAARGQFREALAAATAGDHRTAVRLFRGVLQVRSAPPVHYNLAHSLVSLGEFAEADEQLQLVLEDAATAPALRSNAADLRLQMEREGGRLRILLEGETGGVFVTLDGRELRRTDALFRVRSGAHEIVLEREGTEVERREVTVATGQTAEARFEVAAPVVQLSPEEAAAAMRDAHPMPAPVDVSETERRGAADWRIWAVVGGVVVVAVAVGLAVGLRDNAEPHSGDFSPGVISW